MIFHKPTYASFTTDNMSSMFSIHFHVNKKNVVIPYRREKIQQIFKQHDANGDGSLSLKELATTYGELCSIIPNLRAHLSLFNANVNGDEKINS